MGSNLSTRNLGGEVHRRRPGGPGGAGDSVSHAARARVSEDSALVSMQPCGIRHPVEIPPS
jgi:hypothetical protein